MPNEAADALAELSPALLRFATKQLETRHLDTQQAEDLLQEALVSWVACGTVLDTKGRLRAWLQVAIIHRAENMRRRHPDVLDHDNWPLEFNQIEEE